MQHPTVELEYLTLGPVSATAAKDGSLVVIDFAKLDDPTKAIRLGIPAAKLQSCVDALLQIQAELADPNSPIFFQPRH